MKKAIRLLTMCILMTALLTAMAVWAAADAADEAPAAEAAGPMEPVDTAASQPAGSVYSVCPAAGGDSADTALTVVDYAADGPQAGVCFSGESRYYYGAQITGADVGVTVDGAVSGYFGSSSGTIPLYGPDGTVSGIVWGDCRATSVECGTGLLLTGPVTGGILVDDGASFTCSDAVVLCAGGSGSLRFHNARLSSGSGELLRMQPEAGDVSISFENGSYSGALLNESPSSLTVSVGSGALLAGDVSCAGGPAGVTVGAGGIWLVQDISRLTSLTVEDGATIYGTLEQSGDGTLVLRASDALLEPGTYEAEPIVASLPMGPGLALSVDKVPAAAPEDDADPAPEQTPDPQEDDAQRARNLFPLVPAPEAPAEEQPQPADPAEDEQITAEKHLFPLVPAPEAPAEEQPQPADPAEDEQITAEKHLFPLVPASEAPAEEQPHPADPAEDEQITAEKHLFPLVPAVQSAPAAPHTVTFGVALACRPAQTGAAALPASTVELAAHLASQATGQPPAAVLLKAGAKTHSFLPQALDNRAIILYNPYCCSAA